jgi:hypothetical protein
MSQPLREECKWNQIAEPVPGDTSVLSEVRRNTMLLMLTDILLLGSISAPSCKSAVQNVRVSRAVASAVLTDKPEIVGTYALRRCS